MDGSDWLLLAHMGISRQQRGDDWLQCGESFNRELLLPIVFGVFFCQAATGETELTVFVMIAAVFGLVFLSVSLGGIGLHAYKSQLATDACDFADMLFVRIFADHDPNLCIGYMTEQALSASGGRDSMRQFLKNTLAQAGDVHEIRRPTVHIAIRYGFPAQFRCSGIILTEGIRTRGPVRLRVDVVQAGREWRIESISWRYANQP